MNIDKKLESLKKINRVDAPPFMLTRIMEQVQSPEIVPAPSSWRLAFFGLAIMVLSLNATAYFSSADSQSDTRIDEVISSMELSTTNHLYND